MSSRGPQDRPVGANHVRDDGGQDLTQVALASSWGFPNVMAYITSPVSEGFGDTQGTLPVVEGPPSHDSLLNLGSLAAISQPTQGLSSGVSPPQTSLDAKSRDSQHLGQSKPEYLRNYNTNA